MQKALLGTAKGLIEYHFLSDAAPRLFKIHFIGFSINLVYVDLRTDRWWAGVHHKHWGQKLHFSDDGGQNWEQAALPSFQGEKLPNGNPARLRQLWCMAACGPDKPGELWVGTDPGGLFVSRDNGASFSLVRELWDHPSRKFENQWFGAGSDFPFIHSIQINPKNSDHIYIAVSCAGVFESTDGGKTWIPRNSGLNAFYLPNPHVEVGHDPHILLMHPKNPQVMWQQNHCGVYFSDNAGKSWVDISRKDSLPNYGFCLAIDEEDPARAWVIPVESDEQRIAPGLKLQVYQTDNFGADWKSASHGLPEEESFDIVLRQAFARKGELMLFGTTNGNVYYSSGKHAEWMLLNSHLIKVNAVFLV